MNWVDWVIGGYLLFGAVRGYSRGLVKSFLMAAGPILGTTAAVLYYQPLAYWLNLHLGWSKSVSALVAKTITVPTANIPGENPITHLTRTIGEMHLPPALTKMLVEQINHLSTLTVQSVAVNTGVFVADMISRTLVNALSFCLIVFIIKTIVDLVVTFLSQGLGLAGSDLDHLGGLAFGLLQSGLILAVVLAVLAPLMIFEGFRGVATAIAGSVWANWFIQAFYTITQG